MPSPRGVLTGSLVNALACSLCALFGLVACGGSSSETPPPLQPLPPNVQYDRAATTLPGEQGLPEAPEGGTEKSDGKAPKQPAKP